MRGELKSLPLSEATFAGVMGHPRRIAALGLAALILVGWAYIALMVSVAGVGGTFASLGPGMAFLDGLTDRLGFDRFAFPYLASSGLLASLLAVCTVQPGSWGLAEVSLHLGMWVAMVLAMMLPTAAPMLRTYAEIADTAAGRGRRVVSPFVLAAGYLAVWLCFAVAATGLHWVLGVTGVVGGMATPVTGVLAAAIVAGAGVYQFLPIKAACLVKCANPFPYLFANWTERSGGVFRLGLRQGAFCLGCCWAMMLVMFAAGTMNLVWIAIVAVLMMAEKAVGRVWFSRTIGVAFLGWAGVLAFGGAASFV